MFTHGSRRPDRFSTRPGNGNRQGMPKWSPQIFYRKSGGSILAFPAYFRSPDPSEKGCNRRARHRDSGIRSCRSEDMLGYLRFYKTGLRCLGVALGGYILSRTGPGTEIGRECQNGVHSRRGPTGGNGSEIPANYKNRATCPPGAAATPRLAKHPKTGSQLAPHPAPIQARGVLREAPARGGIAQKCRVRTQEAKKRPTKNFAPGDPGAIQSDPGVKPRPI